ncbi:MAG: LuxR C-terminal-related transcriptional regulator [Actinomycetota bacterium]|nr:LuxR C-terminal-related transcriptional regulator [Actinomycetota bacterium]
MDVVEALRTRRPEIDCATLLVGPGGASGIRERLLDLLEPEATGGPDGSTSTFAPGPRLVVVDGGEHLLGDVDVLAEVLESTPELRLLITSRVPLGLRSERVIALRGLDTAVDGDAVRLFLGLAAGNGVEIPADDRARVRELVAHLGGHPLAIRLCALRLQNESLSIVHERVAGASTPDAGIDPVVRELVEWSLARQKAPAVRLLQLLTVFSGWTTLDSIEGVTAEFERASGVARRSAGKTLWLAQLIESGLVEVDEPSAPEDTIRRYRVHDTVRDVAAGSHAGDEPSPSMMAAAHRTWYATRLAELAAAVTTRRETDAFEQLHAEFAEYAHTLEAMVDADPAATLRIVNQLGDFWVTRGRIRTGAHLLRRALRLLGENEDGPGTGRREAVLARSWLHQLTLRTGAKLVASGYQDWLAGTLREARDGAVEPTREDFLLAVHYLFAALANNSYDEGLRLGERFRDLAIDGGDDYYAGAISFYLARVAEQSGDVAGAAAHIERATVHVRRTQNESFLARCVSEAVLLEQHRLSPNELVEQLAPLPEIHLRNRAFKDAALISVPLAIAYVRAGRPADSLALLRRTLALSRRIHFFDGQLYAVVLIAFSELSEESAPDDIATCARLYGGVRPYLKRFYAVTPPHYQQLLQGGIQGLRFMLGRAQLDRIASQAPTSWPDVMAEADDFAAVQLQAMAASRSHAAPEPDVAQGVSEALRQLNDREHQLLELVLTGITDKQIATQLELKPNTVRSYNSRLFRKLGVASRTELLALMRDR